MSFLRYLGRVGISLVALFFSLLFGAVVWFAWSWLAVLPGWARIVVWLPAFGLTLWACAFWYRRLWRGEPLSGTGWFAGPAVTPAVDIAVTTVAVWFLLTGPFTFGTYLSDRDRLLAQLEPKDQTRDASYKATDQYGWHAADVLPFIKATETLNWTEPSRHWKEPTDTRSRRDAVRQDSSTGYSGATGVLLVIYKILVLAPMLAAAPARLGRCACSPRR